MLLVAGCGSASEFQSALLTNVRSDAGGTKEDLLRIVFQSALLTNVRSDA